ncbi:hypothetical protein KFL_002640100 [Klebsormidium nitens]|uniref:EF-hand domain-containing protein n=1 Tax=Klebsormidium nitens TaxID=105231 RepID=A0A0U9HK90_KLENI|nr:hypothetical protein KFL_002640100 [Klebsormidium nitens]|eukprot:GAQ85989.1 hypothetical protein KFL_002640100 [Klebsormidium nitens]
MSASRSPVPRLDKLASVLVPDAPRASAAESGDESQAQARASSASEASHPPAPDAHHSNADPRRGSRSERKSPPRSPQARRHGKTFGVPNLAPLSAIISGANGSHGPAKKPNSQTGRMKAVLRERAVSRGVRRAGLSADAGATSSPEPQEAASPGVRLPTEAAQTAERSGVTASGADSPPLLSPESSSAAMPDAALLPMVTEEDIQRAFRYFAGGRAEDEFTDENLLERCSPFYPALTGKDVRLLMGHGAMSADKLRKVVHIARHRDLAAFDPIAEAFKVLDPRETGHADMDVLADLLAHLPGVHRLTDEDRRFLLKISDIDGDGLISEADFRRCSTFLPPTAQDQAVARAAALRAYY